MKSATHNKMVTHIAYLLIILAILLGEYMRDNKHLITINGEEYFVDRTFDGSIAVFEVVNQLSTGHSMFRHIHEPNSHEVTNPFTKGDIVIIAKRKAE